MESDIPIAARPQIHHNNLDNTMTTKFKKFIKKIANRMDSGIYRRNTNRKQANIESIKRKQSRQTLKKGRGENSNPKKEIILQQLLTQIEEVPTTHTSEDIHTLIDNTNNSKSVIIKQTLTNGDCFYSAIYRGASEREGLLDTLYECLDLDISDEIAFITSLRNKIADRIISGDLLYSNERNGRVDLYDRLISLMETNEQYQEVTRNYPEWFNEEFGKNGEHLGLRAEFCERLAGHIRISGEWAGEIDVYYVKDMLVPCNIILKIHRDKPNRLQETDSEKTIIHLYNPDEKHYKYFSFMVEASLALLEDEGITVKPIKKVVRIIEASTEDDGTVEDIAKPVKEALESAKPINICAELFDPCTREPIANIQVLERRVRDIKKVLLNNIDDTQIFPREIKTRLDLLLFMLNRPNRPDDTLINYNINGVLYESYWDIVFSLGLIDEFPINDKFYMFNGKIETLTTIDDPNFIANPLEYLRRRNINEGSKSGASDITFVYKEKPLISTIDTCSAPLHVIASTSCSRGTSSSIGKVDSKPQFFFCSSKYFNRDASKGVDKFDIQNIYTAAKNLANEEYDKKIILLVKDKDSVDNKLQRALRKYISEEARYVYGMNDLLASLTKFYDIIHNKYESDTKITEEILSNILHIESGIKPIMELRLHQHIAVNKIHDAIMRFNLEGAISNNRFLVGIVPRGGKTYIAGGIISALNPRRVVVLLGAKSETLTQFKDDLFDHFQNFNDYICIDVVDTTDIEIDIRKKYIFIMSIELYKSESRRQLLIDLKSKDSMNHADLFICDEAHLKTATVKAETATVKGSTIAVRDDDMDDIDPTDEDDIHQLQGLDKLIQKVVPVVYMTGTYNKPLNVFKIPHMNTIIWDYQDIQYAKELIANEQYFKDTFGDAYDRSIKTCITYGQTYESIQNQYRQFPELHLLTTQFTPDAKTAFLKQPTGGGFPTLTHLFEVKKEFNPTTTAPSNWYTGFRNYRGLLRMINYFSPPIYHISSSENTQIEPISSVIQSVDAIAQRVGDRLGFVSSNFVTHTQLWFLPHMHGHPLFKRMCALAGLIFQNEWFRKYFDVIAVSSSVKWNVPGAVNNSIMIESGDTPESCGMFSWYVKSSDKSLKASLLEKEGEARNKGKGLIILAQNMLHLGISLPCVDIVVLLDTGEKIDERIQKMYRALTESTNKKAGYIIDMNYFRTVTALTNYQIASNVARGIQRRVITEHIPDILNRVLQIYSIDDNKPLFKETIIDETLPELERTFGRSKHNSNILQLNNASSALNKNIENVVRELYTSSYDDFLRKLHNESIKKTIVRREGADVNRAEHDTDGISRTNLLRVPELFVPTYTESQKRAAFIELFKTTLKLGAFATNADDISILEGNLSDNADLRDTLYDTLVKRGIILPNDENKDYIIDNIIRPALRKMIAEDRGDTYHNMSEKLEDLSMYPKNVEEVLKYIVAHLTPKATERHKYGEVFTPMTLVHEMLDTLPSEVWNDKSLKWLDPANGMGNFPIAVFLRLHFGFRTVNNKYVGLGIEGEGTYDPGLTDEIKSDNARCKHIIEKMLYMVELNSKNIAISKKLFKKLAPGVEPNIIQMHRKDGFLADVEMRFPSGVVDKFDIIMGNPPFQAGAVKSVSTSGTRKMRKETGLTTDLNKNLWIPFTKKSLAILKKDGYLLFIHPIGWFKPDGLKPQIELHNEMLSKQLHTLKIYKNSQAGKLFGGFGTISLAYYLLQNKNITEPTTIIDIQDNIDIIELSPKSVIILAYNAIFNKIMKKTPLLANTDDLKQKYIPKSECKDSGRYKNIQKITEEGNIIVISTDKKLEYHDYPKIFIDGINYPRIYYDEDGEYGVIDQNQYYIIGENLERQVAFFNTKLSALLLKYIKYRQDFIEPRYYPDIRELPIDEITDATLADYFGLTKKEREIINSIEFPVRKYKFKKVSCADILSGKLVKGGSRCMVNKTRKIKYI